MSAEDGERSGRPKEISTERVHYIIHVYLGMRKLCARKVPRELTFYHKRRVDDSEQYLKMIKRNKPEFLHPYVTMDETWQHHFTQKSNRQSSEWTAHDEHFIHDMKYMMMKFYNNLAFLMTILLYSNLTKHFKSHNYL
ncbi:hypothetical protein GWI33_013552 [Rhynchophorus ferrugineus]|uniref:Transposase n=1 Tax=Rhynchophorus ferrugineus TaxID=354439 RepID=A0A834I7X2_RHYFE|nr:hypothetical protein GWI33_013552 [Rhynchophorus ferrugineus]